MKLTKGDWAAWGITFAIILGGVVFVVMCEGIFR